MPWFYCDSCGDSIKKPKLQAHMSQCAAFSFSCIDCSRTFDRKSVHSHTQCVTEHEKYAQGVTKAGGYAAQGFFNESAAATVSGAGDPQGLQFLSKHPPWKCSICNVACTSEETLLGHAAGAKHKRRARAALAAQDPSLTDPTPAQPAEDACSAAVVQHKKQAEKAAQPAANGHQCDDQGKPIQSMSGLERKDQGVTLEGQEGESEGQVLDTEQPQKKIKEKKGRKKKEIHMEIYAKGVETGKVEAKGTLTKKRKEKKEKKKNKKDSKEQQSKAEHALKDTVCVNLKVSKAVKRSRDTEHISKLMYVEEEIMKKSKKAKNKLNKKLAGDKDVN